MPFPVMHVLLSAAFRLFTDGEICSSTVLCMLQKSICTLNTYIEIFREGTKQFNN